MRSAAVIGFIGLVAAVAIYCARRPTVARGEVIAAMLAEANPYVTALDCQREIPIGRAGAQFACTVTLQSGEQIAYTFAMDREGKIDVVDQGLPRSVPRIKKTADPWGD